MGISVPHRAARCQPKNCLDGEYNDAEAARAEMAEVDHRTSDLQISTNGAASTAARTALTMRQTTACRL